MDVQLVSAELTDCQARLEILTDLDPSRICAEGHRLNYTTLGEARTPQSVHNFMTLLRRIAPRAEVAVVSRGFRAFIADDDRAPIYPSQRCFDEELTWLFWHGMQS
jgi:hypothetical protein